MEASWDPWEPPLAAHRSNPRPIVAAPTSNRHAVGRVRGTPEPIALHNSALPGDWKLAAACRGIDTDLFFPRRGQDQTDVKVICETCPVRVECRDYSLGVGALLQGIWGGQNERQRRKARTDRARENVVVAMSAAITESIRKRSA